MALNSITPTGRTRHRVVQRFLRAPLLVLQVEMHTKGCDLDAHGFTPDYDYCFWRDALPEDISVKDTTK